MENENNEEKLKIKKVSKVNSSVLFKSKNISQNGNIYMIYINLHKKYKKSLNFISH